MMSEIAEREDKQPSASLEERADKAMREIVELGGESFHFKKCVIRKHMIDLESEVREDEREQCLKEAVKKESYLGQEPDPNPLQKNRRRTVTKKRNRTWQEIAKAIRERGA